jgi:outer membrane receptor protein involved in Fe transport
MKRQGCYRPAPGTRGLSPVMAGLTGLFCLAFIAADGGIAVAAPPAGAVEGVAKDALQRPLPGATLRLETPEGRVVARTTATADGRYVFSGVAPGVYSVIGEKDGFDTATAIVSLEAGAGASADLMLSTKQALDLAVIAQRLDEARLGIQPQIGASSYTLSRQSVDNQPGGANAPLNQVILQAPGVDQDNLANGGIHVRNEHLGVQYRINGVILPEGVTFFGQGLSPRFVNSMDLITGALPAEYGLRTSGILDIQTKSGLFAPGGTVSLYGGSYGTIHPSAEYGGSVDGYNYYLSTDFLQSSHGIDAVTPKYNAIHDDTEQTHAFAYLDKILDSSSKVSLVAGLFDGQFQIPNNPGQPTNPAITFLNGAPVSSFDSRNVDERQTETSQFAVLSYLRSEQELNFEVSAFTKYSTIEFHPDALADIAFNGIAQGVVRRSFANGVQADGSYKIGTDHTLRAGTLLTGERVNADTTSSVLIQDGTSAQGNPTFGSTSATSFPTTIVDNHAKTGWTYSAYLQDEWRITPTVTLNYGGRFDVVDTFVEGNQVSPRVNAVWKATPSTVFHAGYANYFTPPSFELVSTSSINLFNGTSGQTASPGSSPIKIERSHYFDVGATQDVLPGLKVGLDIYYKYSRNLIDEGQFGAPVLLTPFNYHVGYNKGVELSTTYVEGAFSYYGNLAIAEQKAEGINSAQFNFTAEDLSFSAINAINTDHSQLMTASAGLSYLWLDTRYSADIVAGTGLRTTRSDGPINGGTVPSYEQVNLGVSHVFAEAPGGPLTVRLDVINLLDEVYLLRSQTGIGVFAPAFGPRRSVFAGVSKQF